jgi:microcystin-dependent protein
MPTVSLASADLPAHTHGIPAHNIDPATANAPDPSRFLALAVGGNPYSTTGTTSPMSPKSVPLVGGGGPHNNLMPYLTMRYCIALEGIYPPRQ